MSQLAAVVVRKCDKGFGFLRRQESGDKESIFFHSSSLTGITFDEIAVDDLVEFDLVQGPKGPAAEFVRSFEGWGPQDIPSDLEREIANLHNEVDPTKDSSAALIRAGVRVMSRFLASEIARNPDALFELEWRDLERTVAEVFEGLGFTVVLTPSSKDGGKDLILEYDYDGRRRVYIVEVKHWRQGKRVGGDVVRKFVNVIVRERRDGGLLLSTSGYSRSAFEHRTRLDRQLLRFGGREKILWLCRSLERVRSGLWSAPENLVTVLHEQTI